MDKYVEFSILIQKAIDIIENLNVSKQEIKCFLNQYKNRLKLLKQKSDEKSLLIIHGAGIGLWRTLEEYTGLEDNKELCNAIEDIENYYSNCM